MQMDYNQAWISCMENWLLCIKVKQFTWCVAESKSINDHVSLDREEKSTPIWTPTPRLKRLKKKKKKVRGLEIAFLPNQEKNLWW